MKVNNLEYFLKTVQSGKTAYGMVITMFDPSMTELAADSGMDFVWIDMEHSPMTITDVQAMLMAIKGTRCAPFVRVPWNVNYLLKPILDLGPAGVIIPMVNTAKIAREAVKACRYPVHGGERGFATRRQNNYNKIPIADYIDISKNDPLVIIQIEHRKAVQNIDKILAVPGIDSVCIGPYDLSTSYGKPGQFDDPEIIQAIDTIREKTKEAGIMLGGFCGNRGFWENRWMNWKALCDDVGFMAANLRDLLKKQKATNSKQGKQL
jgi:2-keto-3-deoxy-L-rhamnonate aldolase RhmA